MNDPRYHLRRIDGTSSRSPSGVRRNCAFRVVTFFYVVLSIGFVMPLPRLNGAEETPPSSAVEFKTASNPKVESPSDSAPDSLPIKPDTATPTNSVPTSDPTVSDSTKTNGLTAVVPESVEKRDSRSRDRRRRDRSSTSESASESKTNAAVHSKSDFAAYKIITDRNIFSPSRTTPSAEKSETRRVPKVDSFWLVGTLSYDKGDFAFFDGSSGEYRKAIQIPGSIAGHAITGLTADEVTLEFEGKPLTMRMGSQRRREDDGVWESRAGSTISATSTGDSSTSSSESGAESSSGGAEDEILQRLLKKREQELKNEKP